MKKTLLIFISALLIVIRGIIAFAAQSAPSQVIDASNSVVRIFSGEYCGSGFVINTDNEKTLIVTNYHVIDPAEEAYICLNQDSMVNASIYAYDAERDLCVLKISVPLNIPALHLKRKGASRGEGVYTIGYPGSGDWDTYALDSESSTITDGIVGAIRIADLSGTSTSVEILQINAAINPGNSGGPVLDNEGNVVGISDFYIEDSQGIFGAVSVLELMKFLDSESITWKANSIFDAIPSWAFIVFAICLVMIILIIVKKTITKHWRTSYTRPVDGIVSAVKDRINAIKQKGREMFNKETTTVEEYTIVTCNRCGTRLRVPNDRGNIKVTCPNCKKQFLYSGISNANRKSNKKKPIIIGCIVAVMLLIIFLVPTPTWLCSHQWVEATCTAPRTCSRCGLVEGTALGHNWLDATCTDPKKCSKCGTTEGKPLDHVWTKETRDYPATCEICGKLLPMQMPANGREFFSHVPNRNSALKITSSSSQSYFVKLKDVNGKDVIGFFVRPGQTTTVTVPTGKYQTFFATGTDWYGIDRLFGDDTQYFKDRELLNYTYDEYWEYNLTPTYNGNFSETKIDASEF